MAIIRQQNFLGQQRVDIPHLRAIESAVAGDFDILAGNLLSGNTPCIVKGFFFVTSGVSSPASSLVLRTAGGMLVHYEASETGSVYQAPADRSDEVLSSTNSRVVGGWTPNTTNYVGIDLARTADSTTADTVMFLDPSADAEMPVVVPLARTLDYKIVISTLPFSSTPGICPLAKIVINSSGQVSSNTDCRWMMFGLASGGDSASTSNIYSWPNGRTTYTGEQAFTSLRDWMQGVMTRLWELGGGEKWFNQTADRNVFLVGDGSTFTSNGEAFEWTGGYLHWQKLYIMFDNSTAQYNIIEAQLASVANYSNLAENQCMYVDLQRDADGATLVPVKGTLSSLGVGAVPGSRFVIALRKGGNIYVHGQTLPVGFVSGKYATETSFGSVRVSNDWASYADRYAATLSYAGTDGSLQTAACGGVSRSRTGVLAAGDICIGLGTTYYDRNVKILTDNNSYDTSITGLKSTANTVTSSVLRVVNTNSAAALVASFFGNTTFFAGGFNSEGTVHIPRIASTTTPTLAETTITTDTNGVTGCKMYVRNSPFVDEAATSPTGGFKLQLCIQWPGTTSADAVVLAESPLYVP